MKKYLMPLALGVIYGCSLFEGPEEIDGSEGDTFKLDSVYVNDSTNVEDTTSTDSVDLGTPIARSDFLSKFELTRANLNEPLEYKVTLQTIEDSTVVIKNNHDSEDYAIFNRLFRGNEKVNERVFPYQAELHLFENGWSKVIEQDSSIFIKVQNARVITSSRDETVPYPLVYSKEASDPPEIFYFGEKGEYHMETDLIYSIKELGENEKYLTRFISDNFVVEENSNGRKASPQNLEMKLKGTWKIE